LFWINSATFVTDNKLKKMYMKFVFLGQEHIKLLKYSLVN